jgi:hypothetical protein
MEKYQCMIGLTVNEAQCIYRKIRVVKTNGVRETTRDDVRLDRLNVAVVNGVISELIGFG